MGRLLRIVVYKRSITHKLRGFRHHLLPSCIETSKWIKVTKVFGKSEFHSKLVKYHFSNILNMHHYEAYYMGIIWCRRKSFNSLIRFWDFSCFCRVLNFEKNFKIFYIFHQFDKLINTIHHYEAYNDIIYLRLSPQLGYLRHGTHTRITS